MPKFGKKSRYNLATCHPDLQRLFNEVIKHFDCSIICGHRTEDEQNELYLQVPPVTTVQYPNSNHNSLPSKAVDAAPYVAGRGIVWDKEQLYFFAAFVWATAIQMGIKIRLGADWDGDGDIADQTFFDRPHFELKEVS